jgi:hypothetical protein
MLHLMHKTLLPLLLLMMMILAYGQDPATGLPQHRREQLLQVFRTIDKDGVGISLRSLQTYANKYGGETLTLDDLRGLFADFKPAVEHFVSQGCALLC